MKKHHLLLSTLLLLIISVIVVSGCSNKKSAAEPNEEPEQHENETPFEEEKEQDEEETKITEISIQPESLILSPGSKYQLSLSSTMSDKSQVLIEQYPQILFTSSYPEAISIDEAGVVHVTEDANIGSSAVITAEYSGLTTELAITISYSLEDTVTAFEGERDQITNADSYALVVNKQRSLPDPASYKPEDLTKPDVPFSFSGENERNFLRKDAAKALEELFAQAEEDNIELNAVSGYRSYGTQSAIFNNNLRTKGEEHTLRYSAFPGTSEHQTGLAMDVSSPSVDNALRGELGEKEEGIWLAAHAPDFGFIIRYPEGKEAITGYAYEPWHLRYVGIDLAQAISSQGLTMEEYFAESIPVSQNVE